MIKIYEEKFIEYRIFRQERKQDTDGIYLITVRDVTRLRQLETVRRDFIANVSHEFKIPLSTIRGYTETLLSGTVDNEHMQIKFLKKIERQITHIENLVSNILQLAKIEKKNISDMIRIKFYLERYSSSAVTIIEAPTNTFPGNTGCVCEKTDEAKSKIIRDFITLYNNIII